MTDRIDPIRRRPPGMGPLPAVTPVERRDRDAEEREEPEPRRRPAAGRRPPPDDGLPHVDVIA